MKTVSIEPNFKSWREMSRLLLGDMVEPANVIWRVGQLYPEESGFDDEMFFEFGKQGEEENAKGYQRTSQLPRVPKHFMSLAETLSSHRSGKQWAMLYEILWIITYGNNKAILYHHTHPTIRKVENMRKQIGRDIHKMRAFVRFRKVSAPDDDNSGREHFVSWFEPDHLIVRLNANFFRKRFAGMNFSILTPDECMHWDGNQLSFTEGVAKTHAPEGDELETLWKSYYRSIFNPARVKIKMMQTEMPKKYWKNLPEADIIEELIRDSSDRISDMMEETNRELKPRPKNAYLDYLDELNQGE